MSSDSLLYRLFQCNGSSDLVVSLFVLLRLTVMTAPMTATMAIRMSMNMNRSVLAWSF